MTDDPDASFLYYAGFNAHLTLQHTGDFGILQFPTKREPPVPEKTPNHVAAFTWVPFSSSPISVTNFWSAVFIQTEKHLFLADPCSKDYADHLIDFEDSSSPPSSVKFVFGDIGGLLGAVTHAADIFIAQRAPGKNRFLLKHYPTSNGGLRTPDTAIPLMIRGIAIAGNDQLCVAASSLAKNGSPVYKLHVFRNFVALRDHHEPTASYTLRYEVESLAAGATAFVALLFDGTVWTFGSNLQPALLARTPKKDSPADLPCLVDALGGIAIKKVAMCEWIGAALSHEKDLYIWGGRAGETQRVAALPESGDEAKVVDIAGGFDIHDFAVGMGHIVVLTVRDEVWVCGDNEHGQLGLGVGSAKFVKDWAKVAWGLNSSGGKPIGVEAGGWGSWVLSEARIDDPFKGHYTCV